MHCERNFLRLTIKSDLNEMGHDQYPKQESNAACKLFCFAALDNTIKDTFYSDLTGKFSVRSHKGNQYIFITYVYDANAILIRAMSNHEADTQVKAFKDIYAYLKQRNFNPVLHVMDNECSQLV